MRRVAPRRREHGGLLTRRPQLDGFLDLSGDEESNGIDWVDQLRRLVDLYDRGLVSREQLHQQQERALRFD